MLGQHFSMPLLFLQGENDAFTVTSEVQHFADGLVAPRVEVVTILGGGHNCIFLRDRVLKELRQRFAHAPRAAEPGAAC